MTITNIEPAVNTVNFDLLSVGDIGRRAGKDYLKLSGFQELGKQQYNLTDSALTSAGALDGQSVDKAVSASLTVQY